MTAADLKAEERPPQVAPFWEDYNRPSAKVTCLMQKLPEVGRISFLACDVPFPNKSLHT